jgi:hypothetical protein
MIVVVVVCCCAAVVVGDGHDELVVLVTNREVRIKDKV